MSQYWFRRKTLGIGATPASWEGWLVTLAYVGLITLLANVLVAHGQASVVRVATFAIAVVALTGGLIFLTVVKGDHVWGGDRDRR